MNELFNNIVSGNAQLKNELSIAIRAKDPSHNWTKKASKHCDVLQRFFAKLLVHTLASVCRVMMQAESLESCSKPRATLGSRMLFKLPKCVKIRWTHMTERKRPSKHCDVLQRFFCKAEWISETAPKWTSELDVSKKSLPIWLAHSNRTAGWTQLQICWT